MVKKTQDEQEAGLDLDMDLSGVKTKDEISMESDVRQIQVQVAHLIEENNKLWKTIKDKGMEIGMPAQLMNDIAMLSSNINRMKNLWDSEQVIEKEKKEDEEIQKKFLSGTDGSLILAYHMSREQIARYRQDRIRLSSWLDLVLDNFRRIQGRMQGHEMRVRE